MTSRKLFIDNLRWIMIILVISMHAADTYSPFGNWYYVDREATGAGLALVLGTYQSFLQAFFMGLLFAVSGYFAEISLRKRGPIAFAKERAFRLGLPVLLYMLVIGPITQYFIAGSWRPLPPTSFGYEWLHHIRNGEVFSESGPLWFCVALLLFSWALAALPQKTAAQSPDSGAPTVSRMGLFIASIAVSTFAIRLFIGSGRSIFNLQLGDFAQYVLMFAAGVSAARSQWPDRFRSDAGSHWLLAGVVIGLSGWLVLILLGGALTGDFGPYRGGWHWQAGAIDIWSAFVGVAVSMGLVTMFRDHFDAQNPAARFLSNNAFAVYVFHPPILILFARLLHTLSVPNISKFILLTALASCGTYAFTALIARRLPLIRQII